MIRLRTYRPGDEAGIGLLFEQVFGKPLSQAEWSWKYRRSLQEGALPIVAVQPSGDIVGHAGAVLLPGVRNGRRLPFLQICDVMVHPQHRGGLGESNLYTRMIRQFFDRLADTFPDAYAYGFPGTRPFKLGDYARVYEAIERARETTLEPRRPPLGMTIQPAALDAPGLDRLWRKLHGRFPLALVRDRDYLSWRYRDHPTYAYRRLDVRRWGRRAGWVIHRRLHDQTAIVDCLCDPGRLPDVLGASAWWLARHEQSPCVTWLPTRLASALAGTGQETDVVVTNMMRAFQTPTDDARATLYYSMGDLDIF